MTAIRVDVVSPNGLGAANINVTLLTAEGKLDAETDYDGTTLFPKKDAATSTLYPIHVCHLETNLIPLNPAHDDFTFKINGQAKTVLRFTGERLTVNGNAL